MANTRKLFFEFCVVERITAGQELEEKNSERPGVSASDIKVAITVEDELGSAVEKRIFSKASERRFRHVDWRVHHIKSDI